MVALESQVSPEAAQMAANAAVREVVTEAATEAVVVVLAVVLEAAEVMMEAAAAEAMVTLFCLALIEENLFTFFL